MDLVSNYIAIDHDVKRLAQDSSLKDHVAHLLCLQGEMKILFSGNHFVIQKDDIMALPIQALLEEKEPSDDFQCICMYVAPEMIEIASTPPLYVHTRHRVNLQEAHPAPLRGEDERACS